MDDRNKKQMQRSFEGKRYSREEMCTLLQVTAQKMKGRPLYLSQWAEASLFVQQMYY
jgi:hypothetical protein